MEKPYRTTVCVRGVAILYAITCVVEEETAQGRGSWPQLKCG